MSIADTVFEKSICLLKFLTNFAEKCIIENNKSHFTKRGMI